MTISLNFTGLSGQVSSQEAVHDQIIHEVILHQQLSILLIIDVQGLYFVIFTED